MNERTKNDSVADQNVERLIHESYRPENPDAAFVARVEQALLETAKENRPQPKSVIGRDETLPASPLSPWQMTAGWGVAIALLVAIIGFANLRRPAPVSTYQSDGDIVWIDGKPYVPEDARRAPLPGHDLRPLDRTLVGLNPGGMRYDVSPGLVARERAAGAKPQAAGVGDAIVTAANEQRRLMLPDGSVLYVDEATQAKIVGERRIEVTQGEVFIEVAPKSDEDDSPITFLVNTPTRTVTALGTKFGVRTGNEARVIVTQGKVEVSDADQPLTAGQQLLVVDEVPQVEPAPRADVALDWMRELVVAAEGALIPANDKAGGDLIAVDPDGQDVKLSLRKYHIDVHIEDGFARTTIDQTYFNHMHSRLEGTFYFPLPPDASLSRLAMYVGPNLMEGGMAERDYARQVFETIKTRKLDPALLEWVDGSTFKMRVFPLEGREEKRIILSYTQKLDINYGRTRYRFPAGHNMKVVGEWSTKLRIKNGARLLWDSPSHTLKAEKVGGDLVLTAEEKLSRLDRDVVLFLSDDSIARADVGRTGSPSRTGYKPVLLSTTTHEDAHYLMLRWRPELPREKVRQRRDWVFLFESSADRDPLLARTQIEIVRTMLNHAEHDDTFAIVTAGAYTAALDAKPLAATHENIARAIKYLDQTHLVGALDVEQAFRSLQSFVDQVENPTIVHVGSGVPVLGEREQNVLVQAIPEGAKYVGVGVGKRFNRSLMKQAAARTGGYFTEINPDESTSWRGFELVSALNTPRLLEVKIETDSGACQMLSFQDWLAHGEELTAIGRYDNASDAPSSMTITGQLDGQPFVQTAAVKKVAKSTGPLPRMWAKQQIELLTSLGAEQHKDRIIKLSKAMYVMSPFTSLLVLENEAMYAQYKIDRGRKDHWALYPAPERIEVVEERGEGRGARGEEVEEGGENDDRLADDGTSSKPSVREVLATIQVHRPAPVLYWPQRGYNGAQTTVLQALNVGYGIPVATPQYVFNTVTTTVTAADGGTILITGSGVRSTTGVPILTKLPYVNRLFRDHSSIRPQPLMMMATPRIIIQEEEFERLGIGGFSVNGTVATNHLKQLGSAMHNYESSMRRMPIRIADGSLLYDARVPDGGFYYTPSLEQMIAPSGSAMHDFYSSARLGNGRAAADFDSLIDLITATVRPTTWNEVGGLGAVEPFPGNLSLVISQTQNVQSQAMHRWGIPAFSPDGRLLATGTQDYGVRLWNGQTPMVIDNSYSMPGDPFAASWPKGQVNPPGGIPAQAWNRPGYGWYHRPDMSNGELLLNLYEHYDAPDARNVYRGFIPADPRVVTSLRGPLHGRGDVRLPARYHSVVSDYYRVLREDESGQSIVRFESLMDETLFRRYQMEVDTLFQVERAYVPFASEPPISYPDPRDWEELALRRGMFSSINLNTAVYPVADLVLPIRGTPSPFYELGDVPYFPPLPGNRIDLASRGGARERILAELDSTTAVDFVNTPLADVIDYLKDLHGLEIQLDQAALEAVDVGGDTPITRRFEGITLRSALLLLLREHGLTYVIRDEVLLITSPEAIDQAWMTAAGEERDRVRQSLADYVNARVNGRIGHRNLLYERPEFTGDNGVFSRLTSYAPGLNTTTDDVNAVLEAEANVARPIRGSVDAGAKRLIERARSLGWQQITWNDEDGQPAFSLTANGQNHYHYSLRTRFGLHETVLCDGKTLRHHYDEIGLGATRQLSRFHRQALPALVPWAVLPAGDLALGSDVRLVNENTIALVPLFSEWRPRHGHHLAHSETHLVFADDGRLAERRIVSRPSNEVLLRTTYSATGVVRWLNGEGKELGKLELAVSPAKAPALNADESQLVMLPMPLRTRDHVFLAAKRGDGDGYADMPEDVALQLIASHGVSRMQETMQVIGQRFIDKGDRRIGFYTLLLGSYAQWSTQDYVTVAKGRQVQFDPLQDHPNSPLAKYIVAQLAYQQHGQSQDPPHIDGPADGFIQQLGELRRQYVRWSSGRANADPFGKPNDCATLFALADRLHSPEFRWAILNLARRQTKGGAIESDFVDAYERLVDDPALGYVARYELGRALYGVGDYPKSREVFTKWYGETLAAGVLPRFDSDFRSAFQTETKLFLDAGRKFVDQGRRPTAIALGWQLNQAGDPALGNELLSIALAGIDDDDRFATNLAGVEYLWASGQQRRALVLLEPLLSDENTSQLSALWRLGSSLAHGQGMTARSARMFETALALEYGALEGDDVINLAQLRSDYGELLGRYEQLATALASLEEKPSPALLARLIGAADRWRSMEDDVGLPCNRAAKIFAALGADQLAWQYVTTPLAAKPNEATPWLELASNMQAEDNYVMADRAYREAFRSEGTNAQILWDHAQMLTELGRYEEARRLRQQIAETDWQPRFQHLKTQAQQVLGK